MTAAPWLDRSRAEAADGAHAPLDREALADHVRAHVFPAAAPPNATPRIGAEVEVIPLDAVSRRPLPLDGDGPSTLAILRRAGASFGWCERFSAKANVPEILLPDGGRITFEPGGQIELSPAPNVSLTALAQGLRSTIEAIASSAPGVELLSLGIDPDTPIGAVTPQLHAERYCRMLAHFDSVGPSGARMMRQTASFQVCVDGGEAPELTWRVLNALAPYMVAVFANSNRYGGQSTGHLSYRRAIWATLDPRRTGVLGVADDVIEEYVEFALGAPAFLLGEPGRAAPFHCWLDRGAATWSDWDAHLSTLFPEIRPRGYFEVRSADVVPPAWFAAPLIFVAGLVYHHPSLDAAADLLGPPSRELLACCGRVGLRHPTLGRVAPLLCDLALDGCAALGERFVSGADLASAAEYFDRYTRRGRSLAHDDL